MVLLLILDHLCLAVLYSLGMSCQVVSVEAIAAHPASANQLCRDPFLKFSIGNQLKAKSTPFFLEEVQSMNTSTQQQIESRDTRIQHTLDHRHRGTRDTIHTTHGVQEHQQSMYMRPRDIRTQNT